MVLYSLHCFCFMYMHNVRVTSFFGGKFPSHKFFINIFFLLVFCHFLAFINNARLSYTQVIPSTPLKSLPSPPHPQISLWRYLAWISLNPSQYFLY